MGLDVIIEPLENKGIENLEMVRKELEYVEGRYGSIIPVDNLIGVLNRNTSMEFLRDGNVIYLKNPETDNKINVGYIRQEMSKLY